MPEGGRKMTKRTVRALLMALVMVIALIGAPGKASAAGTVITVAADKTEAEPGDTINLSIILGPVSEMGTMQMVIVIPNGLTYVKGSGALAENLKSTLGYDMLGFTEGSMMVNGVASKADYASEGDTLLCTFQCTVNEGFHGTAEVGLTQLEFYSCRSWKNHTSEYSVQPARITVAGGETEPSVTPTTTAEETTEGATEESTTPSEATKPDETTKASEATKPNETTKAEETAKPEETTKQSEAETSKEQPEPAASSESSVKPSETTKDQTPSGTSKSTEPAPTTESRSSSKATESGEDATEKASEGESKETEEGRTAPENTDQPDSGEAAETTEEQSAAETESTGSEADTKENTDESGTTSAESDKNIESDPSGDEDSTRKGGWIWLAAVVMVIIAGTFFVIFLARRKSTENVSERGRSRKKVK